jgi:hypothetical protein
LVGVNGQVLHRNPSVVHDLRLVALYLNGASLKALRVGNNVGLRFGGLNTNAHRYKKCNAKEFNMFHVKNLSSISLNIE